jgi:hypothetical protein
MQVHVAINDVLMNEAFAELIEQVDGLSQTQYCRECNVSA